MKLITSCTICSKDDFSANYNDIFWRTSFETSDEYLDHFGNLYNLYDLEKKPESFKKPSMAHGLIFINSL